MNVRKIQTSRKQHAFWRKLYIRLLTEESIRFDGMSDDERSLKMFAIKDLIEAKFMDGHVTEDAAGIPQIATGIRPTLAGRIFAEQQQDILDKKSILGRIKSGSGLFIGWLAGILSALIIWKLTKN